jgi:hypothetical protein
LPRELEAVMLHMRLVPEWTQVSRTDESSPVTAIGNLFRAEGIVKRI